MLFLKIGQQHKIIWGMLTLNELEGIKPRISKMQLSVIKKPYKFVPVKPFQEIGQRHNII